MELKPEAMSPDGYIIDQRKTDNIRFGALTSNQNGCGWIACYNFLKALDAHPDPESLLRRLERTLLLGGHLGLHFFALVWELRKQQHVPLDFALRPFHAQQLSETAPAGIIMYYTGKRNHFAAFRRTNSGKLQFYGAIPGSQKHITSMADFYWNHVKFPLALTITAKPCVSVQHKPADSG